MLVIVDMQNQILDEENEAYVPDSAALVKRIAKRLEQARANGEYILHTRDIPIEVKGTPDEEAAALQLIPELKPLENEKVVKKYYYSIPPEVLIDIKKNLFEPEEKRKSKSPVLKPTSVSFPIRSRSKAPFLTLISPSIKH